MQISLKITFHGLFLLAALFLYSGCTQQYVYEEHLHASQPVQYYYEAQQPASAPTEIECSDEVSSEESNCNRGEISREQLTGKNTQKTSVGVTHSLKSIQGHTINVIERPTGFLFPNYKGKIIILVMFGKNCPHCIHEIPILKKLKQRYRGQVEVVAIQTQDRMSNATARRYLHQHRINYPLIEGENATDLQYFIQNTYGWTGILPFTIVVKNGVTEMTYPGAVDYNEMRADMDTLF